MTEQWPSKPPEGPGPWWAGCLTVVLLILAILAAWAIYRYWL
jgi:uncharacterized membrane protein YdbT with pleckstrin-like domain